MSLKSFSFKTKDGFEHWINRWIPDSDPAKPEEPPQIKGIIVFNHGLAEHSMRYDRFGSVLSENGYVFNAFDMRGHGRTAEISIKNGNGDFGKLADKNGFETAVNDVDEIMDDLIAQYPGKPVFLMAHSFGSFVAQSYIERFHGKIKACFLIGTAGPRPLLIGFGGIFARLIKFFCGGNKESPMLEGIAFGAYNKRIKVRTSPVDWLTKDQTILDLHANDAWSNIHLKISFFCDMMHGLKTIHKKSNMAKIDKDLPVYLLYGLEDPVGDYGKTPRALAKCYEKLGMKNVTIKEYPGDRHEILNETDKEQVEKDIINMLDKLV
ncbi:MAG: alpha/beta fold hydrolase [Treponema sp.]|nr:alpha/beta fold hydrolase [Treponema sp.]